jgi:hypothetical protein
LFSPFDLIDIVIKTGITVSGDRWPDAGAVESVGRAASYKVELFRWQVTGADAAKYAIILIGHAFSFCFLQAPGDALLKGHPDLLARTELDVHDLIDIVIKTGITVSGDGWPDGSTNVGVECATASDIFDLFQRQVTGADAAKYAIILIGHAFSSLFCVDIAKLRT